MPKRTKSKPAHKTDLNLTKDMWINPKTSLKGDGGNRAWDHRHIGNPASSARFLELADLALGLKKPEARKRKAAAAGAHEIGSKTEPYSS